MLTLHNIEVEVRRVFSDCGERPLTVRIDIESYHNLLWETRDSTRDFGHTKIGIQELKYIGAFGEVIILPDKHLPLDTVWAGPGDYVSYWAGKILLNDDRGAE